MEEIQTEVPIEPMPAPEGKFALGRILLDILETLVLSVLLFAGINYVSARIRVDGFSMEPSLHTGEFVIVNKLAYTLGETRRGDVIVFQYPFDPRQEYIKRVIGLPGDIIRIENGRVYVNGQALQEDYIAAPPGYNNGDTTVPENSLFVLGDNRNNSSDSHNWGSVPMEYVIGKASLVYWPPEQWGLIPHTSTASATP